MGLTMLDPDGQGLEKTIPGSDHSRRAPGFRTRISVLAVFRLRKVGALNGAFAGLLRAFWLEDKRHEISKVRYKSGIFWLASERLTRRSPSPPFIPLRTCTREGRASRNSRSNCSFNGSCDSQLLLVSLVQFFWQRLSQDFQPIIDQRHAD